MSCFTRLSVGRFPIKADLDHIWQESLYYNFGTSRKLMFDREVVPGLEDEIKYTTEAL